LLFLINFFDHLHCTIVLTGWSSSDLSFGVTTQWQLNKMHGAHTQTSKTEVFKEEKKKEQREKAKEN